MLYRFIIWNPSFAKAWDPSQTDSVRSPIQAAWADEWEDALGHAIRMCADRGATEALILKRLAGSELELCDVFGLGTVHEPGWAGWTHKYLCAEISRAAAWLQAEHPEWCAINPVED